MKLRIGINTGPVFATIIGRSRFVYDISGDTVDIANYMESKGEPGAIQVTEAVLLCLGNNRYRVEERGLVYVEEVKENVLTYWLTGKV